MDHIGMRKRSWIYIGKGVIYEDKNREKNRKKN